MNLRILTFLFFCFIYTINQAQEQWASTVIKYSSQAGYKAYGAKQVLGAPNALQSGKNPVAWSSQGANAGIEYIVVGFSSPTQIQQVAIWENFNPGAIYQIILIEESGKEHTIYEQKKPDKVTQTARMFRHTFRKTSYEVSSLKLVLNTAEVFGLNQIDAIGISTSNEPMRARINNSRDKTFVGKPENLGYEVNSKAPDLLPLISVDGQTLYFARKESKVQGGNLKDDIYVSYKNRRNQWAEAFNIGPPLNDDYNNFVCAVNPDGTEVLISGRYDQGEGLYRTALKNDVWSKPKKINIDGYVNKSPFVCYHVSPDMKYLVIAMEDQATYGDMDIYVSFLQPNGNYSKPKNLGPIINTAGTEPSVFLSADTKTIYFSSDGHAGYGAYDMFMSRRLDNSWGKWTEPINLGDQINSDDWDLYYTVPANGEYAYYSSAKNSYGESDLYRIKLPKDVRPEPVAIIKPTFVNMNTKTPVADLKNNNTAIVINQDSKVELYEEVKGFYPVNETEDLSESLEEVDDFTENVDIEEVPKKADPADAKMNDLLARLQELKNEQAKTETQIKKNDNPTPAATPTVKEYNPDYASDIDDKLAALRSDMDKIEQGKEPVETDLVKTTKEYKVKPGEKISDKEIAKQADLTNQQQGALDEIKAKEAALDNFRTEGGYNNVAPRSVASRKTYDLKTTDTDDYINNHQTYKEQLQDLADQKAKAAYGTQPLSKYSLAKTAIDEATQEELIASSMNSELADLKKQQKETEVYNPELDAYKKKLAELKAKQSNPAVPQKGTRIVKSEAEPEATTPKEVDPEVLAFQEKLAALKNKMNALPSAETKTEENVSENTTEEVSTTNEVAKTESVLQSNKKKKNRNKQPEIVATPEIAPINTTAVVKEEKLLDRVEPAETNDLVALNDAQITKQEQEKEALADDINSLKESAEKAKEAQTIAEINKAAVEAQKEAIALEKQILEAGKQAMEVQKKALEEEITELQREKDAFLADKAKIESDKEKLEKLRLQQHKEVKKLEADIRALEQQKGKAQEEVALQKETTAKTNNTIYSDKEILLMPIEEGVTVEIKNVFFNANSAYVKPQSYRELDKVVAFLEVNNAIQVEIGGHTNGLCQTNFCNQLSEKRAVSVREYLVSNGVSASRIVAKGYGKSNPIADNNSTEGRKKNQRVELKILKVK